MDLPKENLSKVSNQLEKCFERYESYMKKASELSMRLTVLGFKSDKTLRNLLAAEAAGNLLLREDPDEETCSSSENEDSSAFSDPYEQPKYKGSSLNCEDQFLCSRAIIKANWFWLKSEILRAKNMVKNLKKVLKIYEKPANTWNYFETVENDTCARARAANKDFVCRRRNYLNLLSLKNRRILSPWFDDTGTFDGSIRCSCDYPNTGACILCCGNKNKIIDHTQLNSVSNNNNNVNIYKNFNSSDYLKKASQLVSSIHPKLSSSSDIPPSLRIESRLVAPQFKSNASQNFIAGQASSQQQNSQTMDRKQNQLHPKNMAPYVQYLRPKIMNRYWLEEDANSASSVTSSNASGQSPVTSDRQNEDHYHLSSFDSQKTKPHRWGTGQSSEICRGGRSWLTEVRRQAADLRYESIINNFKSDIENLTDEIDDPFINRKKQRLEKEQTAKSESDPSEQSQIRDFPPYSPINNPSHENEDALVEEQHLLSDSFEYLN